MSVPEEDQLFIAIDKKEHAEVRELLAKLGANIRGRDGSTPLLAALRSGDRRIFEAVLAQGADVNDAGGMPFTPLVLAVAAGMHGEAELLLKHKADVNLGTFGKQAINYAIIHNKPLLLRALLKQGAVIVGPWGAAHAQLELAVGMGHDRIAFILREKLPPPTPDDIQRAPYLEALYAGKPLPADVVAALAKTVQMVRSSFPLDTMDAEKDAQLPVERLEALAKKYGRGEHVPIDKKQAYYYSELAASKGSLDCLSDIALDHVNGLGAVPRDLEKGFKYFEEYGERLLLEGDHADKVVSYVLYYPLCLFWGMGCAQDREKAQRYLLAAAAQGFDAATELVGKGETCQILTIMGDFPGMEALDPADMLQLFRGAKPN